jgi:hypothetical protein
MVAALVVVMGACGDGGGGNPAGGTFSCGAEFPGTGMFAVCIDVSGGTGQDVTNGRQQCDAQGNTFALEPCPRTGALGGCRQTPVGGGVVATTWYYGDGGLMTADDIQMLCEGLASVAPSLVTIEFVLP